MTAPEGRDMMLSNFQTWCNPVEATARHERVAPDAPHETPCPIPIASCKTYKANKVESCGGSLSFTSQELRRSKLTQLDFNYFVHPCRAASTIPAAAGGRAAESAAQPHGILLQAASTDLGDP
eukprot:151963-Amphidinium_carterae.1